MDKIIETLLKFSLKRWLASELTDLLAWLASKTDPAKLIEKVEHYLALLEKWYGAIKNFLIAVRDAAKDGKITEDEVDDLYDAGRKLIDEIK